ncbi:MAG TPA: hypothetical protein VMB21_13080 [Candidatus Limnocylindria bacterium]|jgi:hypothetical protein|nr:hypothetical protein [Candidatus Limnocylindria bacterium]
MKTTTLKLLAASMFAASAVTMAPALALDAAGIESLNTMVSAAKVVETPLVAARLVSEASKEDKEQVAVAVVTAAIRSHPSSIGSVITAVLRKAPETMSAVVAAALDAAPDSSLTIIAAAAEGAPDQADKAVAVASKKMPSRTASFEREVAVVRGRRTVATAVGFGDTGVTQTKLPGTAKIVDGAYGSPGGDPGRN